MKEAMFYKKLNDDVVQCLLCNRYCVIKNDEYGNCGVRKNINGKLYSLNHSKACSVAVDPIEKKPFYHFKPGEYAFSIATAGCNFHCLHCQNYEISQARVDEVPYYDLPPELVVKAAEDNNVPIIAYTYTEPTVFFEYCYDTGLIAKEKGIFNVFVTNGYASPQAVEKAAEFLDAARIDLKGDAEHYDKVCGGVVYEKVLECIKNYFKTGMHLEIITLLIPGHNDDEDWIREAAGFIKSLSPDIPWHFTRFYPAWKMMNVPPTDVRTLLKARRIAVDEGIKYVYVGNVLTEYNNTYCHNCGELLIRRDGFSVVENKLEVKKGKARCPNCGVKIPGFW